eukprot:m.155306 g.155306  ORF g.155306 m.155306 type:complete len:907 (+) comp16410_c0_seq5:316-3036(+)
MSQQSTGPQGGHCTTTPAREGRQPQTSSQPPSVLPPKSTPSPVDSQASLNVYGLSSSKQTRAPWGSSDRGSATSQSQRMEASRHASYGGMVGELQTRGPSFQTHYEASRRQHPRHSYQQKHRQPYQEQQYQQHQYQQHQQHQHGVPHQHSAQQHATQGHPYPYYEGRVQAPSQSLAAIQQSSPQSSTTHQRTLPLPHSPNYPHTSHPSSQHLHPPPMHEVQPRSQVQTPHRQSPEIQRLQQQYLDRSPSHPAARESLSARLHAASTPLEASSSRSGGYSPRPNSVMVVTPQHRSAGPSVASTPNYAKPTSPTQSTTPMSSSSTVDLRRDFDESPSPARKKAKKVKLLKSPTILNWLHENYELKDGVSLPRSDLYEHYMKYCTDINVKPINAATFGKIIRQQFPDLKTRRLGTRGQSKYHYYGIRLKPSSKYNHIPLDPNDPTVVRYILPAFPSVPSGLLPANVDPADVGRLLTQLRNQYELLIQAVLAMKYDSLEEHCVTFWRSLSSGNQYLMHLGAVVDLVCVCDNILYSTILSEVISNVLQPLPMEVLRALRNLSKHWVSWIELASTQLPRATIAKRVETARVFTKALERQTSLNHVAQAADTVFATPAITEQMRGDWTRLDFEHIEQQMRLFYGKAICDCIAKARNLFSQLLARHTPLDKYVQWFAALLDNCVMVRTGPVFQRRAKQFLLIFNYYTSLVTRDLRRRNAMSFSSFHLVKMLFDEYFTFLIERRLASDHAAELRVRIGLHEASSSSGGDSSSTPMQPTTPGQRQASSNSTTLSSALDNIAGQPHPQEDETAVDWLTGNKSVGSSQPMTDFSGFDPEDLMAAAHHMEQSLGDTHGMHPLGGFEQEAQLPELSGMPEQSSTLDYHFGNPALPHFDPQLGTDLPYQHGDGPQCPPPQG